MCFAAAAAVASVVSTGVSVYGALKGGKQEQQGYNAQAAQAMQDSRNKILDARAELDQAYVDAGKTREYGEEIRSAARSGYAASGVDVGVGTAFDVQQDITERAERDALNQVLLGDRKRRRLEGEAVELTKTADQLKKAGKNAKTSGKLAAAGSLLAGAANLGNMWQKYAA